MKNAFRVRSIADFVKLEKLFPQSTLKYMFDSEDLQRVIFDNYKDGAVFYLDDNNWTWNNIVTYCDSFSNSWYLWEIDAFMKQNEHTEHDDTIDNDLVHHPSHYTSGSKEVIDIAHEALTEEEFTGAMKFNIIKYTLRVGKKDDPVQEMGKVANYADYLGMHLSGNWIEGAH